MIDYTVELENKAQELFIQTFVEQEVDGSIERMPDRLLKCYKTAYPDVVNDRRRILSRARTLMQKPHVKLRVRYLIDELGTGIENEYGWTLRSAEAWIEKVMNDPSTKAPVILKAIEMRNHLRGIGEKQEEEVNDSISNFFKKIGIGEH